jgi:hypothetical protein
MGPLCHSNRRRDVWSRHLTDYPTAPAFVSYWTRTDMAHGVFYEYAREWSFGFYLNVSSCWHHPQTKPQ